MSRPDASRAAAPLRALIVDDEPLARDCVRIALEDEPGIEVVGECGDGKAAVDAIRRLRPDLVFLDVQMPGLDGFGVVERVGADRMPAVVFVTAYDEHALRAFAVHALDYVLKPFDDERFRAAVAHARRQLERRGEGELSRQLQAMLDELGSRLARKPASGGFLRRLQVPVGDRIRFVDVDDVDYFESAGNYVRLHIGKQTAVIRGSLASLEERLDPDGFLRIHRSTILNLDRLREVEPWGGGQYTAILDDGRRLRVSRSYREALLGS